MASAWLASGSDKGSLWNGLASTFLHLSLGFGVKDTILKPRREARSLFRSTRGLHCSPTQQPSIQGHSQPRSLLALRSFLLRDSFYMCQLLKHLTFCPPVTWSCYSSWSCSSLLVSSLKNLNSILKTQLKSHQHPSSAPRSWMASCSLPGLPLPHCPHQH